MRDAYPGKEHLERSLKTSDPATARKEVILAEADFIRQIEARRAAKVQEATLGKLTPEQRKLYFQAGGLTGLLAAHEQTLISLKFMEAGDPRIAAETDEDRDPLLDEMEIAEHNAATSVITQKARSEAKTLKALGQGVSVPGGDVTGLRELAAAYFKAKGTPKLSQRAFLYPVRRFIELHGDLPLHELTMEHIRIFSTEIRKLTPSRKGGAHKLSFHENARAATARGLSLMTDSAREKAADHLKYLTAWAPLQGYMPTDPWAGFKLDKIRKKYSEAKRQRDPFSGVEIAMIFSYVREHRHPESIDYWAPMLAAYQGARREEIGQMELRHVCQIDGEWVLKITDEGEHGKVKNSSSLRNMPIHPKVVEAGFLDFVQRRQAAPTDYLFREETRKGSGRLRDLKLDADERVSGSYGKRFAADLRVLKIKRSVVVYHSFRHSWETIAEHVSMPRSHRAALAGRSANTGSADFYGDGPAIRQGRVALALIDPLTLETGVGMRGDR